MKPTELIQKVCDIWDVPLNKITGKQPQFCEARYAYFWKMKELFPDMFLRQIGELNERKFSPQAVHEAFRRHHELMSTNIDYKIKYRELESMFVQIAA